ncbi:hypothetical protein K2X33_11575 [bacterium]|nr:hypothetical protein [bacterium]
MRIAVLPPRRGPSGAVENYLWIAALRALLPEHDLIPWEPSTDVSADFYIFLGNRFLEPDFEAPALSKETPAVALGVSFPDKYSWTGPQSDLFRTVAKAGAICVTDEVSLRQAKLAAPASRLAIAASPALFAFQPAFTNREAVPVFCPAPADPGFTPQQLERLNRAFFATLNRKGRALCLLHQATDAFSGAGPGMSTLFEPDHPALHGKALVSAAGVAGFHLPALFAAAGAGVPAVLLGNNLVSRAAGEAAGIPFIQITTNTHPAELEHRVQETFRKYPWETFQTKSQRLKDKLVDTLKDSGLKVKEPKRRAPIRLAPKTKPDFSVATIAGREDLPSLAGLVENLREQMLSGLSLCVLALDRQTQDEIQKRLGGGIQIYLTEQVCVPGTMPLRSPRIQRALLLPRFLRKVLERENRTLIYCEPSIGFYGDPTQLLEELESGHTLFFPRWLDSGASATQAEFEAGLLAVTPASVPLLHWWEESLGRSLERFPHLNGRNVPEFLPLAPYLFPGARVYRGKDQLVSADKRCTLGVELGVWAEDAPSLHSGAPVQSFLSENPVCYFSRRKTAWDQLSFIWSGGPNAPRAFLERVWRQQSAAWTELRAALGQADRLADYFPWVSAFWFRRAACWIVGRTLRHFYASCVSRFHWGRKPLETAAPPWVEWAQAQQKYLFGTTAVSAHGSDRQLSRSA